MKLYTGGFYYLDMQTFEDTRIKQQIKTPERSIVGISVLAYRHLLLAAGGTEAILI